MATTTKTRRTRRSAAKPASKPSSGLGSIAKKAKPAKDVNTDDLKSHVPSGLAGAFVDSKLHEKKLRQAGLEPPSDFTGEMPELPEDIDAVDHSELSNTMVAFQNALATATWQAAMAYIANDIYDEIADYLENRALLASEQSNDKKRQAEARTDDTYLVFRGEQKKAYHDYVRFRDFARTIDGKIKVLSRVGGFKDDEHEASDRSARSKPSVGRRRSKS